MNRLLSSGLEGGHSRLPSAARLKIVLIQETALHFWHVLQIDLHICNVFVFEFTGIFIFLGHGKVSRLLMQRSRVRIWLLGLFKGPCEILSKMLRVDKQVFSENILKCFAL